MTFFIDGLRPETMKLVSSFRENKYRQDLTLERLIQFAKDEEIRFVPWHHALVRQDLRLESLNL